HGRFVYWLNYLAGVWHCQAVPARILAPSGAPVRQSSVRAHNLALVLRRLADGPCPPSRAAIATATGLTRATVSALVDELIAGGLVIELEPAPRGGAGGGRRRAPGGGGGRGPAGRARAPDGPAGLGLEINVDYLAACVVDLSGAVRHRIVEHGAPTPPIPRPAPPPRAPDSAGSPPGRGIGPRRTASPSPPPRSPCPAWSRPTAGSG